MAEHTSGLPVAVQLYTLRTLSGGIDTILADVAAAGYPAVETVGDHGLSAEDLGGLLVKHGLRVISTHVEFDAFRERTREMIAFNKAIGNTMLVVPYIPALRGEARASVYAETGRVLGDLARQCRDAGTQLLYHNHNWEIVGADGHMLLDVLFESAGTDLGFEPDLAWIAAAGVDPVTLLRRYSGRCLRVHLKDLAPQGERPEDALFDGIVMADVGYGRLDWPTLLAAAKDAGAAWYIVEHDNPRDPVASISRSLAYLRSLPATN